MLLKKLNDLYKVFGERRLFYFRIFKIYENNIYNIDYYILFNQIFLSGYLYYFEFFYMEYNFLEYVIVQICVCFLRLNL